jgi:hypothetical protein
MLASGLRLKERLQGGIFEVKLDLISNATATPATAKCSEWPQIDLSSRNYFALTIVNYCRIGKAGSLGKADGMDRSTYEPTQG